MSKNLHNSVIPFLAFFLLFNFTLSAATFTTTQSGDWSDANTWAESGYPTPSDIVIINDGHIVTITGTNAYTFYGNIVIKENGELLVDAGNSNDALIFCGGEFHVFGKLTFTADKDFSFVGAGHFWGHPGSEIWITDDWKVSQYTTTTVESICVRVDDDFHIKGTNAIVCGDGGVSIGGDQSQNTFNLFNDATLAQVCNETIVYRQSGGSCGDFIKGGIGNSQPIAYDDSETTSINEAIQINVLNHGISDTDPEEEDVLTITSVGTDFMNNQVTKEGGTVSINNNGTENDPTDDFIDYVPAPEFVGTDEFQYVITDSNGGFAYATVTVEITAVLPVELVSFKAKEAACKVNLSWVTETELDNSHFDIERSVDGYRFSKIGQIKGSGTSNQYHVYDFVDAMPTRENYYRLKQVDFNGTSTYSDVIFVKSECLKNDESIGFVNIFPNPAMTGEVNMRFEANVKENAILSIADIYGKNILREEVSIEQGMNSFAVDINDLKAGTYILSLGRQTTKFIKAID